MDNAAQAGLRVMILAIGEIVTFERITGVAPSVTLTTASLMARVRGYKPESGEVGRTGYSATQMGAITQTDRIVIICEADLAAAGFPVPVLKNDKVVFEDGTKGNVTEVDTHKRSFTGGVEVTVSEIQ